MKIKFLIISFCCLRICISAQIVVKGYVLDKDTKEQLAGVLIRSFDPERFWISDEYGFFQLHSLSDTIRLEVTFLGYAPLQLDTILASSEHSFRFYLQPQPLDLPSVTVTNNWSDHRAERNSQIAPLSIQQLTLAPAFGAETDLLKSLALNPGVSSNVEGTANLLIRGGSPDQNLVLLDGIQIYNPVHLGGFLSIVNPNTVGQLDLYKGGFPARFGGRLSSVLDILTRSGNKKTWHGTATLGLMTSGAGVEGPVIKDRLSINASLRASYAGLLAAMFQESYYVPNVRGNRTNFRILDGSVKISLRPDSLQDFSISYFGSNDAGFQQESTGNTPNGAEGVDRQTIAWGNQAFALHYRRLLGEKWQWRVVVLTNNYSYQSTDATYSAQLLKILSKTAFQTRTTIKDWGFHTVLQMQLSPALLLRFGLQADHRQFQLERSFSHQDFLDAASVAIDSLIYKRTPGLDQGAIYLEDDLQLGTRLNLNVGLRYSFAAAIDSAQGWEPRAALSWNLYDNFHLKVSYDRMRQYLHQLEANGLGFADNFWIPVSNKLAASSARQYSLTLGRHWRKAGLYIETGLFQRKQEGLINAPINSNLNDLLSDELEDKVHKKGKGRAYGWEFFVEKTGQRFNGALSYTLSRSERQFSDLNDGRFFPYSFDRRHEFSIFLNTKLGKRWAISASWVYQTGRALTVPVASTLDYLIFDEINNGRLPAYHRLDLGATYTKITDKGLEHQLIYSIFNAYNRANPFYLGVARKQSAIEGENGQSFPVSVFAFRQISLFPILPSISYRLKF